MADSKFRYYVPYMATPNHRWMLGYAVAELDEPLDSEVQIEKVQNSVIRDNKMPEGTMVVLFDWKRIQ